MTDRLDQLDYYTLLGVEPGASSDQISEAFHQFARKYHPDRFAAAPAEKRARAAQIFRRGTEAFGVLKSPEKRRRYDEGLRQGKLRFDRSEEQRGRAPAAARKAAALPARARPFVAQAKQALKRGDTANAKLNLKIALSHAPGHPDIERELAELTKK